MLRLTARRRAVLVETLRELANLAVAALILGQLVGPRPVSRGLLATGAAVWIVLVALAFAPEDNRG